MSLDTWIAFVVATTFLTLIPGPCVLLAVSQAITTGMRSSLLCIIGDIIGSVVLMILSLIGVGAILATSAILFTAFKWLGVIYMAYLGICQIIEANKRNATIEKSEVAISSLNSFNAGFFASLLNPKAIIFYMAFLPQFMNVQGDTFIQFFILVLTSSVVIAVVLTAYALIAWKTKTLFIGNRSRKYFDYSGASFLIGSSVFMATTNK